MPARQHHCACGCARGTTAAAAPAWLAAPPLSCSSSALRRPEREEEGSLRAALLGRLPRELRLASDLRLASSALVRGDVLGSGCSAGAGAGADTAASSDDSGAVPATLPSCCCPASEGGAATQLAGPTSGGTGKGRLETNGLLGAAARMPPATSGDATLRPADWLPLPPPPPPPPPPSPPPGAAGRPAGGGALLAGGPPRLTFSSIVVAMGGDALLLLPSCPSAAASGYARSWRCACRTVWCSGCSNTGRSPAPLAWAGAGGLQRSSARASIGTCVTAAGRGQAEAAGGGREEPRVRAGRVSSHGAACGGMRQRPVGAGRARGSRAATDPPLNSFRSQLSSWLPHGKTTPQSGLRGKAGRATPAVMRKVRRHRQAAGLCGGRKGAAGPSSTTCCTCQGSWPRLPVPRLTSHASRAL